MKNPFAFCPFWPLTLFRGRTKSLLVGVTLLLLTPFRTEAGPVYGPVTWQDAVNLTVNGAAVTKSGGCEGCPDAYGVSNAQSTTQDTYLQFSAVIGKQVLVGLG